MLHSSRRALPALVLGLAAPTIASAQSFPTRTISLVVPFAAGGPTDTVARLVAQGMTANLGQNVIVENVAGAGGSLGAQRTALARPDGYSLLVHHIGMSTIPTLYRRLGYDPINGFEPLGLITEVPMTIVARRDFPAANHRNSSPWCAATVSASTSPMPASAPPRICAGCCSSPP